MEGYSQFEEMMQHHNVQFNVFNLLALIVLLNMVKSYINYKNVKELGYKPQNTSFFDISISVLAGIGMIFGTFYYGIMSDVASEQGHLWGGKLFKIGILSGVMFLIQLYFGFKTNKLKDELDKIED